MYLKRQDPLALAKDPGKDEGQLFINPQNSEKVKTTEILTLN